MSHAPFVSSLTMSAPTEAIHVLHVDDDPDLAELVGTFLEREGDRSRLRQAFENLLRNAIEHGSTGNRNSTSSGDADEHGGSDVTVTVGALPDGFYVADDGPGIPDDLPDDPFDAGVSTSPEGIGVGLSIVEGVAEAHGWTVRTAGGDGARFEFTGVDVVDG
jgi:signal transduction histidine kinase